MKANIKKQKQIKEGRVKFVKSKQGGYILEEVEQNVYMQRKQA